MFLVSYFFDYNVLRLHSALQFFVPFFSQFMATGVCGVRGALATDRVGLGRGHVTVSVIHPHLNSVEMIVKEMQKIRLHATHTLANVSGETTLMFNASM